MTDDPGPQNGESSEAGPLPPRDPRPFVVHWAVATAVAFLATVILLWFILGVPLAMVVIGSGLLGLAVAPYTSGNEERALARRRHEYDVSRHDGHDDPAAGPGRTGGGVS